MLEYLVHHEEQEATVVIACGDGRDVCDKRWRVAYFILFEHVGGSSRLDLDH